MASFIDLFSPDEDENTSSSLPLPEVLPPEAAEGNIEYKLKLINPSRSRFEHLVTQMKWRLSEGHGEAIYAIGVADGGMLIGLSPDEMNESLLTLHKMAARLHADVTPLRQRQVTTGGKSAAEFLVKRIPEDQLLMELRVAVLGNSDVGKSTLLGVLTHGEQDNGHGSARLNLFRHLHEIQSGRTSSISQEVLGFDSQGSAVTYNTCRTADEIFGSSTKIIGFIDLAGHQKYMKTTVFGLTGHSPHLAIVVISAVSGLNSNVLEHLCLARMLDIAIIVVINKLDLASGTIIQKTKEELEIFLNKTGSNKVLFNIEKSKDALTAANTLTLEPIIPVFQVSCVTRQGLDLLYTFLNALPPSMTSNEREKLLQLSPKYQIGEVFNMPDTGLVVSGLVTTGIIQEGDHMFVGPSEEGKFQVAKVVSLQRHKVPCRIVRANEAATLALSCPQLVDIRPGMVIVSHKAQAPICIHFQAKIVLLCHTGLLFPGFRGLVHISTVRQAAVIRGIMGKYALSTKESASVIFEFVQRPEFIQPGSKLFFRMGMMTKAIGRVTQVFNVHDGHPIKQSAQNL